MKICVNETGYLQLDPDIVHPFCRVHIMDMRTGKYLAKRENGMPGVANKESIGIIDSEGHVTDK